MRDNGATTIWAVGMFRIRSRHIHRVKREPAAPEQQLRGHILVTEVRLRPNAWCTAHIQRQNRATLAPGRFQVARGVTFRHCIIDGTVRRAWARRI